MKILVLAFIALSTAQTASAQKDKRPAGPLLTRTTTRHETYRLPFGGTVTLSGAPAGSITIEGWQRSELEITATIELQAPTQADLDRLTPLNNFQVDVDVNHIRILTTGTHDRTFMKRVAKNFPKNLIGLPWKVDYRIKMPALTDLDIDAGKGPIDLSGVEGTLHLNALSSLANLSLTGGLVQATIQTGALNVTVPVRGWHGLGAEMRLASGNLTVELAPGFSGDVNADVLRLGEIKATYPELQSRQGSSANPRSIRARAGSGGATLSFTVGDGLIEIRQKTEGTKQ
jgi:hypothetical protein